MKKLLMLAIGAAAAGAAVAAEQYDRLLEAIHIPSGAYFNTGCVVKDNPRIIADVSLETTADFDLFAVRQRVAGCWILNCGAGQFWYRYGTAAHGPGVGAYSVWQRLQIECGKTITVNGTPLWTADDYDFSANDTQMEVPGRQYLQACTLRSFKIEDGGQLVRDFVPAKKDGECGLYDRVNDQFYANAGTGTVTEEVNLLSYAIEDASGKPAVTCNWDTVWASGREADKVFDGNLGTYYDPRSANCDTWLGYGLVQTCVVTRIRVYGRNDSVTTARLQASYIEGANESDFSDAVVLHRFSESVPDDWYQNQRWIEVTPNVTAPFKYYRIYQRQLGTENTFAGNVAELEFHGIGVDSFDDYLAEHIQPPTDFSVNRGGYPKADTTLIWSPAFGSTGTTILRATGVNGPWTEISRVSGSRTSYADVTAPAGIRSYYRIAANYSLNGETVSLTNETTASLFRYRLLERDPYGSMTQFRSGVSLIYKGGSGYWTGGSVEGSCMLAFDNAVQNGSNQNHADIGAVSPRTCIGVDLGEPVHFFLMRFFPRTNRTNSNGAVLSGSNSSNWNLDGNFDTITEPISGVVGDYSGTWIERPSLDTDTAYRYLFCHNPALNAWNDNVSELQFYGWTEAEVSVVAQDVTDIAATCGVTPSVTLSWTPVKYGTYTIERKTGDGAWTTVASNLPASTATWADTSVTCDGTLYTYRVTTVNGASEAISADCEVRPYITGNGTGLHAEWWTNFVTTTSGEALALVATNATINFAGVSVGGETENLFARWSGKLIAPCTGDFTFEAEADGVAYLWVDGIAVLYKGKTVAATTLTAGEHDITVLWRHISGAGSCKLYWGGCVTREVIPSTQFIPVPPREIPGEWVGARQFDTSDANALFLGDVKANADGTIDMAQSGRDLSWGNNGYNFLWKPMKGDFTLVAKISCLTPTGDRWYGRKAGLMVRSSLDATANMRAYGIKRTGDTLFVDGRHKTTATGQAVREHDKVAGAPISSFSASTSTSAWVRLRRVGNVFTAEYKISRSDNWALEYEYEDTNGEYGETTYVGLTAWGEGDGTYTTVPCYLWRFSNVRVGPIPGTVLTFR